MRCRSTFALDGAQSVDAATRTPRFGRIADAVDVADCRSGAPALTRMRVDYDAAWPCDPRQPQSVLLNSR
jgi:hypothetical protein